jgi:hypothetical protein
MLFRLFPLILCLVSIPIVSLAQVQPPKRGLPQPAPYAERVARMKAACLTEDRADIQPGILPVSSLGYSQNLLDQSLGVIGKPVHYGVDLIRVAGRKRAERIAARTQIQEVEALLASFASAHPSMSDYQRACLATCASAHLIDYQLWSLNDPEVPSSIIASGRGLCRHFARIASRFLSELGLPGSVVKGQSKDGDHAFNSVRINGEQLWMEPQRDTCQFYRK